MAVAETAPGAHPASVPPQDEPHEASATHDQPDGDLVESELLVEDVSIDGMCGVY
jgi:mycofactocin precursor